MAQRLTKALRDKRRWVGLAISPEISSRKNLERMLNEIAPVENWRLYDFNDSKAIIRILLKDEREWRKALSNSDAEIYSVTMSGKISLVRQRLNLNSNSGAL